MADSDGFVLVGGPKKPIRGNPGRGGSEKRNRRTRDWIPAEEWQRMSKKEREKSWETPRNVARSATSVVRPSVRIGGTGGNAVKAMNVVASSKSSYAGVVRGTTACEGLDKPRPYFLEEFKHEWTSSLSESTVKFLTNIREDKARRESARAWRVQVKCDVLPSIPESVWTGMLRKAALCIEEECSVVETRPHANGIELCLSRPVILDVGTRIGKFEVVLSEPIEKSLCVTMWEWSSSEAAVGELTKEVVNNLCGNMIMLQTCMRRRMMTVSVGPMHPFVGHNALVLEGFPLASRMRVFEKACRNCHGLEHRASECAEFWNKMQIPEWTKGLIYRHEKKEKAEKEVEKEEAKKEIDKDDEKASSGVCEIKNELCENASTSTMEPAADQAKAESAMQDVKQFAEEMVEAINAINPNAIEDENVDQVGPEYRSKNEMEVVEEEVQKETSDEQLEVLRVQAEAAVRMLRRKAHAKMRDEEIEELIPQMMEAARVTGQLLTSPAQADAQYWRDLLKKQRLVKAMREMVFRYPSAFWMVECGGQGNCGLWTILCGAILLGLIEKPETNIQEWAKRWIAEMRKLVDERLTEGDVTTKEGQAWIRAAKQELAERRRRQNMWFDTADLQVLARILGMNVMIMEHEPKSKRGGIAEAIYGDPAKEAIIVFGGTEFRGGHWVLLTNAKRAQIDAIWSNAIIQGTLEAYWRRNGYNWTETPAVVKGTSVLAKINLEASGEEAGMNV